MFVSILQRFVCRVIQLAGEPLQSRADQNTRKIESGDPSSRKPAKKRFMSLENHFVGVFMTGVRQTNQEIWQQEGPNRTAAVWPGSRLRALKVVPGQLSRGDTL
ncbi:hypothetical protein [Polaromonas sp. YR568]|uniref:hypothetical protein n=1 Tax=Polaromonas sp. YR568 TaxID=1855301 RepID=UPI001113ADAD|nr:hypothetical protein [Polaromonas sp. YR568]